MNENHPSLDDLSLFLAVANSGSLSEASRLTGTPLPTVSRRISKLQADLDKTLFLRGKNGFSLTPEGRELAERLSGLKDVEHRVCQWLDVDDRPTQVRITTGFMTARYLVPRLLPPVDQGVRWIPSFVASNARLDIARHEADIGIRRTEPASNWLARRPSRRITYAFYAKDETVTGYVSMPETAELSASLKWLHSRYGHKVVARGSDLRLCLDMAIAGYGQILLPTFAGDIERGLVRRSEQIDELSHNEWLVCHQDARNQPAIRAALDAVEAALK